MYKAELLLHYLLPRLSHPDNFQKLFPGYNTLCPVWLPQDAFRHLPSSGSAVLCHCMWIDNGLLRNWQPESDDFSYRTDIQTPFHQHFPSWSDFLFCRMKNSLFPLHSLHWSDSRHHHTGNSPRHPWQAAHLWITPDSPDCGTSDTHGSPCMFSSPLHFDRLYWRCCWQTAIP